MLLSRMGFSNSSQAVRSCASGVYICRNRKLHSYFSSSSYSPSQQRVLSLTPSKSLFTSITFWSSFFMTYPMINHESSGFDCFLYLGLVVVVCTGASSEIAFAHFSNMKWTQPSVSSETFCSLCHLLVFLTWGMLRCKS